VREFLSYFNKNSTKKSQSPVLVDRLAVWNQDVLGNTQ